MPVRRLVVLLAAALACAPAAPAEGAFPGTNGPISFDRAAPIGGGFFQGNIWTIAPDGSSPLAIAAGRISESDAVISPDGRRIAYVRFVREGSERREPIIELVVANIDGSNARRITRFGRIAVAPSWTPDGTRIVFGSNYRTRRNAPRNAPPPPGQIFSIAPDGSGTIRQHTRTRGGVGGMECVDPVVQPNGGLMAVACFTFGREAPRNLGIYITDGAGALRRITPNGGADELNPAWSPDGRTLAFESGHLAGGPRSDIALMNPDGSNVRKIFVTPWHDTNPVFSPDGTMIAFTSDRDTKPRGRRGRERLNAGFELYTGRLADGVVTRLTTNRTPDLFPDWGPAPR
jgi:Tol biopolymer transport system component